MGRYSRLLVPLDFSLCSEGALAYALDAAVRFGAELHVVHVAPGQGGVTPARPLPDPGETDLMQRLKAVAEHQLAFLDDEEQHRVSLVYHVVHDEAVAQTITAYARDLEVSLVVMGTHGRQGMKRLLLGSVAERVLRLAGCDVLTIRTRKGAPYEGVQIRRIVAPVDFTEASLAALRRARELAFRYGATLDVLHVVEPLPFLGLHIGMLTAEDLVPNFMERVRTGLRRFVDQAEGPDVPVASHLLEGHADLRILEFASQQEADLIVMASHGRTGVERFFLGSVTERVVHGTECPVYVIHASDTQQRGLGVRHTVQRAPEPIVN